MEFESLYKIYRKKSETEWKDIFYKRKHSESTISLPISIHEYNRRPVHGAFYFYHPAVIDLLLQLESKKNIFLDYVNQVPYSMIIHLLNAFLSSEIKASNDIEGVHSSRREIQEAIDNLNNESLRFFSIISKYKAVLNEHIDLYYRNSQEIRALYDEIISNEIDDKNKPNGDIFRKDPVDVVNHQDKVIHQGTMPESEIVREMDLALTILHDETIQLPIRVAIFHYYFGYIHPFYDGNGRMNRFISTIYLAKYFHPFIALRLSAVIKNNKKIYYDAFKMTNSEFNCGDVTTFIYPFLKMIDYTIDDAIKLLDKRINRLHTYSRLLEIFFETHKINDSLLQSIYYLLLQSSLFSIGAGINKQEIMKVTEKSRGTIYHRFKMIPKEHIKTVKKGRTESYMLNVNILDTIDKSTI